MPPEVPPDYSSQIASLERKFRILKRNILGTAASGKKALETPEKVLHFEARLEAATADFATLQQCYEELWSLHTAAGTVPEQGWEEKYDACREEVILAKSYLLDIQRKQSLAESSGASSGGKSDVKKAPGQTLASCAKPNLSPISLPHFSGDVLKWISFRDTFQSIIHNDPTLSSTEKFHYLLGTLSGEAAALVSRFQIEDKSYALAWKKLKENYDNPRVLASLYIQQILESSSKEAKTEHQRYQRFLTDVADSIEGFRSLSLDNPAEFLLASLALRALDPQTRRNFELERGTSASMPTADEVIRFVRQRKTAITMSRDFTSRSSDSTVESSKGSPCPKSPSRRSPKYKAVSFYSSGNAGKSSLGSSRPHNPKDFPSMPLSAGHARPKESQTCPFCQSNHPLSCCFAFSNSPLEDRIAFIKCLKCCKNCLSLGHSVINCKSKWTCRFCKMRHHSLIHEGSATPPRKSATPADSENGAFSGFGSNPLSDVPETASVLLGTAEVLIVGDQGRLHHARAVLDSGSQQTFISLSTAHKIGIPLSYYEGNITGLGGSLVPKPKGIIHCQLKSKDSQIKFLTRALVVDTVAPLLPNFTIPHEKVQSFRHLRLADAQFHEPGSIDVLIGMDLYPFLVSGTPYHSGVDQLFLLPTVFGLIVIGKTSDGPAPQSVVLFSESKSNIEENLKAFWEMEEPRPVERCSPEDKLCEEHFISTTNRTPEGRYMVRLPLLPAHEPLGENREMVTKRFLNLERKFTADVALAESYKGFMREYEDLHHMSSAPSMSPYLIPHHGVWQDRPSGRKLRVVFDASCTSSSSQSLNSILMAGPKLQADLADVLVNFRLFLIPLCADLVKMYRQILIHPDDRHLQHVLWRESPSEAVREMELDTVTYGVRSSAYHALRVIRQLVIDEGRHYPLAVRAISRNMYVDDIAGGADTIEEAKELQNQLVALFAKGCFSLSKWASSSSELVPHDTEAEPVELSSHDSESVKVLGLVWNPVDDEFCYSITQPPSVGVTKRMILSSVARVFDPLGLLAPVVLLVKSLLQEIWKKNMDWDQALPQEISIAWKAITSEWNLLPHISIPRYASLPHASLQVVGFCDASEKAYAAAVYLRAEDSSGNVKISLIKAKTKVAPLKYTSIARLELCGALLLSRVISSISGEELKQNRPICFTDSQVVLSWLHIPTYQLKVFEANRVSEILTTLPQDSWSHVRSEDNPSDLASRGCLPSILKGNKLWWNGPAWLSEPIDTWYQSRSTIDHSSVPIDVTCLATTSEPPDEFMTRFSDYHTLVRTVALILRLLTIVRPPRAKFSAPVGAEEFNAAKSRCVQLCQRKINLKQFSQLSPFVDGVGIIRVGGRLHSAPIQEASKHPILLPRDCRLSSLIIRSIHQRHYHSGPSLTLALSRCEFWIPGALKLIRNSILRCADCRIRRAQPIPPIMAPLPKERFSTIRAFCMLVLTMPDRSS